MALLNIAAMPGKAGALLRLMRVDRPIGTYLLLWPTLMALWLAAGGTPTISNLVIFLAGTFLMRSAGCIINDYADRKVDAHVERTAQRPLATGEIKPAEALALFGVLLLTAFGLVLMTNWQTIQLSFAALAVACLYPFTKRFTNLPQLALGVAFSFGIPMAFTAEAQALPTLAWVLFAANFLWTIAYDTFYAMVDRDDDLRTGIKSTAILFGDYDLTIIALLQICVLGLFIWLGVRADLHWPFFTGVLLSAGMFVYQHRLSKNRDRDSSFKAFLHNNWVGMCWFLALAFDLALYPIN